MAAPEASVREPPSATLTKSRMLANEESRVNTMLVNMRSAPAVIAKPTSLEAATVQGASPSERMVIDLGTATGLENMSAGQSFRNTTSAPLV